MALTLITGCASGIGAATRRRLEASGHRVIGIDRRDAEIEGDLSTRRGRQAVIARLKEQGHGALDHVVLCAGLGPHTPCAQAIAEVNCFGVVDLLDACLPWLRRGSQPSAVAVSSIAACQLDWARNPIAAARDSPDPDALQMVWQQAGERASRLAYAASKNAVTVAVRERARAWGQAGVRLNAVAPGSVETPMQQASLQDPVLAERIGRQAPPLGRAAQADEIAAAIAFLLGPGASFVHGAQLVLDGGKDALMRPQAF